MSVPPPRRRTTRSSAGRGSSWLWLVVLILVGAAVLAARTFGRQDAAVQATPTVAPTRVAPAAAAVPERTVAPTPMHARPEATPTSRRAQAAATTTPVHALQPTATRAVPPTVVPTLVGTEVEAAATPQRGPSGIVALTFDAGADRGYAEDILDRLAEEHVVASFGITGNWAKANADLVRRMTADGHFVFNHTLDHRSFTGLSDSLGGLSAAARRSELDQADAIIAPLIGHTTRPFYRLPYGDDDARVAPDVAPAGYTRKIGWTVDSMGWRGLLAQDILARCLKLAAPNAVYVMHVGRASQDALALPQLIAALREHGYTFTRVDQL